MSYRILCLSLLILAICGCADAPDSNLYSELPGPSQPRAQVDWSPDPSFAADVESIIASQGQTADNAGQEESDNTAVNDDGENANPVAELPGTPEQEDQPAREIKLLVPHKRFLKDRRTGALRVSYDDIDLLKVLNMEPVPEGAPQHFPEWLSQLDGQRIVIRGFMFPTFVFEGVTDFGLARDNGICCFVNEPKAYDMIEVMMAEGTSTKYIQGRPFDVEGVFRIDPLSGDENTLDRVYRIEDAAVVQ